MPMRLLFQLILRLCLKLQILLLRSTDEEGIFLPEKRVYDPKYLDRNEARVMVLRLKIGLLKGCLKSLFSIQPKSVPLRALK